MFVENTDSFLADFSVPAVSGSNHAMVIKDEFSTNLLSNRVQASEFEITYRTAELPGMMYNSPITVDGIDYLVLSTSEIDDGIFSKALLQKV